MWVVILPILFCTMFRAGIGVALFVTLRVDGIVRGYGIASEYSDRYNYMEVSEEEQILPFVGRVFWSSWMDLFGDWCVGITLMMGECFSQSFFSSDFIPEVFFTLLAKFYGF